MSILRKKKLGHFFGSDKVIKSQFPAGKFFIAKFVCFVRKTASNRIVFIILVDLPLKKWTTTLHRRKFH